MKRRDFCKNVGMGSAVLASLPSFAYARSTPARQGDDEDRGSRVGFRFVCGSQADPVGDVIPRITINGCGTFHSSKVKGGGSYDLFDAASPVPKTILGAGKWRATRVLSFNPIGTYGVLTAGILEMDVEVLQEIPSRAVMPATLRVACSLPSGGLDSGEPEGIVLTVPGAAFGPLRPFFLAPGVTNGITIFTGGEEED